MAIHAQDLSHEALVPPLAAAPDRSRSVVQCRGPTSEKAFRPTSGYPQRGSPRGPPCTGDPGRDAGLVRCPTQIGGGRTARSWVFPVVIKDRLCGVPVYTPAAGPPLAVGRRIRFKGNFPGVGRKRWALRADKARWGSGAVSVGSVAPRFPPPERVLES